MATSKQLFLVEDEVIVQDELDTVFTDAGFDVVVAGSGIHALAELEANAPQFEALIIDIRLGAGPNGWEVGRRARDLVSNIPVVYITGNNRHEWTANGVPNSVLVTKPFTPDRLMTVLSTLLTMPTPEEQTKPWFEPLGPEGAEIPFVPLSPATSKTGSQVAWRVDDENPPDSARVSLETSDDIFSAAVNATRMAMAVSDPRQPDNPIVYANTAFYETTGYNPEEVIGRNSRFLQGPDTDPSAIEQVRRAIANQEKLSLEILNYRKDGSPFWNGLFLEPFFDRSGALSYWFSSQADYTRHDAEHMRRKTHQMEALRQLARGIAHDSGNLMHVLLANLDSLRASDPDQDRRDQIDAIRDAVERGSSLTQQLIAFSEEPSVSRTPTDMNELVGQLAGMAQTTIGVRHRITADLAPDLWIADVDAGLAQTNLLNLILNAHDAMPDGGKITLRTRNFVYPSPDRRMTCALSPGHYVLVMVQDNGTGMTPEVLKHAMVPNFTTKAPGKGSGLGLAMVFGFMRHSGGDVVIGSKLGAGTTVSLYFPTSR